MCYFVKLFKDRFLFVFIIGFLTSEGLELMKSISDLKSILDEYDSNDDDNNKQEGSAVFESPGRFVDCDNLMGRFFSRNRH